MLTFGLDEQVFLVQLASTLPVYQRTEVGLLAVYMHHNDAVAAAAQCQGHVAPMLLRQAVEQALLHRTGCTFMLAPDRPLILTFIPIQQPCAFADPVVADTLPWARASLN